MAKVTDSPPSSLSVSDDTDDENVPRKSGKKKVARQSDDDSDMSLSLPASSDEDTNQQKDNEQPVQRKRKSSSSRDPLKTQGNPQGLADTEVDHEAEGHRGQRPNLPGEEDDWSLLDSPRHRRSSSEAPPGRDSGMGETRLSDADSSLFTDTRSPVSAASGKHTMSPAQTTQGPAVGGNAEIRKGIGQMDSDLEKFRTEVLRLNEDITQLNSALSHFESPQESPLLPDATLAGTQHGAQISDSANAVSAQDPMPSQAAPLTDALDVLASPVPATLRAEESEMEDARVRQLVELLERATQQIKAERARAKDLERENQALKQSSAHNSLEYSGQGTNDSVDDDPRYIGLQRAYTEALKKKQKYEHLKVKYRELALENQLAIEQIAVLRIKCIDMQVALETEKAKVQDLSQKNTLLAKHAGNGYASMPAVQPAQLPAPPHQPVAAQPPPPAAVAPPVPTQSHNVPTDMVFSVVGPDGCDLEEEHPSANSNKERLHASARGRKPISQTQVRSSRTTAPSPQRKTPSTTQLPHGHQSPLRSNASARTPSPGLPSQSSPVRSRSTAAVPVPASPKDEVLIHRMIRALSPPPTVSQMGKLVDSMVKELIRNLQLRGVDLPMRKVTNCVYLINNKRLNLAVISDKLVVKVGGGHQDFLEYLNKSKVLRVAKAK
jgi:hypothetical protein